MRRSRKMIPVAVLVLMSAHLPAGRQVAARGTARIGPGGYSEDATGRPISICRVLVLVEQPGNLYTFGQIQEMVRESDVVVRAVAVDSTTPPPRGPVVQFASRVTFETLEVIHGSFRDSKFDFEGFVVDGDDFNTRSVPYRVVRPSGQHGSCYAMAYRLGAEYLFLLNQVEGRDSLTPYWFSLGPTNEQIRGADDPWVQWVREQLAEAPAPDGRAPPP